MWFRCANTAEQIEVLLGVEILEIPSNIVLDGSSDFPHGFDAAFAKLLSYHDMCMMCAVVCVSCVSCLVIRPVSMTLSSYCHASLRLQAVTTIHITSSFSSLSANRLHLIALVSYFVHLPCCHCSSRLLALVIADYLKTLG